MVERKGTNHMKKKIISRLLTFIFMFNIFGYRVQAVIKNTVAENPQNVATLQNDKLGTKSKIMSNYEENKIKKNFKEGEVLVKIKAGTSNSSIESAQKKYNIKSKKNLNKQLDLVKFDNSKYSLDEMLLNLNSDLNIEYAEPNYISKISSDPENEPYFKSMWGLKNTTNQGIDINVETAWKNSTGNPNLVVGVIDTGVDYHHEDLKDNIWINNKEIANNGIDDDKNGYVDDYNGWDFAYSDNSSYDDNSHGTHVSGTIAASSNGIGIVGIAPNVKIMPLKAADSKGELYTSDIVSAIEYGVSKGVKLFNCSFGSSDFSQTEYDAIKNSNALFICAAGNGDTYGNGMDNDSYVKNYPSSFELLNIVSVASMDKNGYLSTFSNYGVTSVDIAAPGSSIYSTVPGGYAYKSGTSMATPHVTGVAALVLSADMNLSPIEVKNCILKTTHKLPQLENRIATGAIVDAFGAMAIAKPSIVINVTGIELDNSSINLTRGVLKQLTATIVPSNASNKLINWTSSNLGVAIVNSTGRVTAIGVGYAVITATTVDGNKISTCNVTVPITNTYYPGDNFIVRINTPAVIGEGGMAYMIKPDGTEESYYLQCNVAEGYYYLELPVNNGGDIFYNEIDPVKDFGTWEVKYLAINNVDYSSTYYYNEKYYSLNSENKQTLNFDNSKFSIASPTGIIKDDTNNLSNNSKAVTPGDITLFKSIEVTKNKVYLGDEFTIKINARDTSGIESGFIYFIKPDGTEDYYYLNANPRGGYYYIKLQINNGGYSSSTQIDPGIDYGTWKIEKIELMDVNGNYTYYNYGYSDSYSANLDAGNFNVYNGVKPIIPTDVDDSGTTDIIDLSLVGLAYNSRTGETKYKSILDINNDGMVDIYDLVGVSKAIK